MSMPKLISCFRILKLIRRKMSWFQQFLKENPCDWECCEISASKKVNRKHFWDSLNVMKKREHTLRSSNILISEKVIHLNDKYNHQSTLTIGLDPENEFKLGARLEMKKTESILMMNSGQLQKIFDFLGDHEKSISQTLPVKGTHEKYGLRIYQTQGRIFDLNMNGWNISIDEDSLKYLCRMKFHIQRLISSLEKQTEELETLYFKLLSHFCYGKTVEESCDLAETDYCRGFFEEITNFHCECLDKPFIIEIALHLEKWFSICVPFFINAVNTYESERLQTFSTGQWPHNREVVDIEKMAKSGLYYIGSSDKTKCTFCGLVLHEWEQDDDPVSDHFKFRPRCSFLRNPENSSNISDVVSQNELGKLLTSLRSNIEEESYDEIDVSSLSTTI